MYQSNGTAVDITTDFVKTTRNRIRRVVVTEVADLREYDIYEFKIRAGYNSMPEKVKQAVVWHCYNSFFKVDITQWYPSFKNLLADLRRLNV